MMAICHDQLRNILEEVRQETGVPGLSVAVRNDHDELAVAVGSAALGTGGELTPLSRFNMSCLMKFFLAQVAWQLSLSGVLKLDELICETLPELSARGIRVTHLLSHTSGYRGLNIADMQVKWNYSWDRFVAYFNATDQLFSPGTVFNYEHTEHVILGEILKRRTGRTAQELVQAMILDPLEIKPLTTGASNASPSTFVANHVSVPKANGYVQASNPPPGKFWAASLPDWTLSPGEICNAVAHIVRPDASGGVAARSPDVMDLLVRSVIEIPRGISSDSRCENLPVGFGFGGAQYEDGSVGHNGSVLGQTCALRICPAPRTIIVVAVNAWAPHARDAASKRIAAAIHNTTWQHPQSRRDDVFGWAELAGNISLDETCGRYVGSFLSEIHVTGNANELVFGVGRGGEKKLSFRLRRVSERGYGIESDGPVTLGFRRVDSGIALFLGVYSYKKVA